MATRIAYTTPMLVGQDGNVIDRSDPETTFNDVIDNAATEMRVVADAGNSSSLNNPSIEDYIQLEAANGRRVVSLLNTMIVTAT